MWYCPCKSPNAIAERNDFSRQSFYLCASVSTNQDVVNEGSPYPCVHEIQMTAQILCLLCDKDSWMISLYH